MPKDQLARGAFSASYGTSGKVGDEITLRNISEEGRDTSLDDVVIQKPTFRERKVRPINNQILVRREEAQDITTSGILLAQPESSKDRPAEGIVIAVSSLVTQVKVGERVLFGKYAGQEVKVGGTEDNLPVLMEEDEIIAVVED